MLDFFDTDAEIATILAHEVGLFSLLDDGCLHFEFGLDAIHVLYSSFVDRARCHKALFRSRSTRGVSYSVPAGEATPSLTEVYTNPLLTSHF
jgi:hypothetical protein